MSEDLKKKLRFHILGIPHTITGPEWSICPFTTKVWKFAKMMKKRGHHIIHYGHEHSNVDCDEHVTLITNKDFKPLLFICLMVCLIDKLLLIKYFDFFMK